LERLQQEHNFVGNGAGVHLEQLQQPEENFFDETTGLVC
jgi:hypothetical protein